MTDELPKEFKYKLYKKPIGRGSFSLVYLGVDDKGGLVAVKQIQLSKIDTKNIDKFSRELEISMKLDHINIVKYHGVYKTEKYWYIVSEFCDCGSLQELKLLKYSESRREIIVKKMLNELKEALQYLLSNNIIHRDLKPSNILLKKTGKTSYTVKLADFGFARYFTETDNTGAAMDDMINTICGSPIYMAPELLIDQKYNIKADLWSFGVVMYELLYGKNPYSFPKTILHLQKLIAQKEIIFEPLFSEDCISLLKLLLIVDPERRIDWHEFFYHKWFEDTTENDTTKSVIINKPPSSLPIPIPSSEKRTVDDDNTIIPRYQSAPPPPSRIVASYVQSAPVHRTYAASKIVKSVLEPRIKYCEKGNEDGFEMVNINEINFDAAAYEQNGVTASHGNSLFRTLTDSLRNLFTFQ